MEPIVSPSGSQFSLRAGALAALRWGAFGGIAAAAVVAALGVVQRWYLLTELGEYGPWFRWYANASVWPALGCTVVLACAGWAAHAPRPPYKIASSLLIIVLASLIAWYFVAIAEVMPRRLKGIDHPVIYTSEFLVLLLPPVLAAVLLTVARCKASSA